MAVAKQFGCKKCGAVVTVELRAFSDRVNIVVKDGKTAERAGTIQIQCKKCSHAVTLLKI